MYFIYVFPSWSLPERKGGVSYLSCGLLCAGRWGHNDSPPLSFPHLISSVFCQPASGFSPVSALGSFEPPDAVRAKQKRVLHVVRNKVPADSRQSSCRWDIPVLRKKKKPTCVSVFPHSSIPVSECLLLLRDLRVRLADVSDGTSRVGVQGRRGASG